MKYGSRRLSRAHLKEARRLRVFAGRLLHLTVYELPGARVARVSCVVPKKIVPKAHDRNTLKRRCREAVARSLSQVRSPVGLLFRANGSAARASFAELCVDVEYLLRKVA